jgi:hypothetical protein
LGSFDSWQIGRSKIQRNAFVFESVTILRPPGIALLIEINADAAIGQLSVSNLVACAKGFQSAFKLDAPLWSGPLGADKREFKI